MRQKTSLRDEPDFRRLWVGQGVSELGSQVGSGALNLIAILVLHASAVQVGSLGSVAGAAALGSSLLAGSIVDRVRRRGLLIAVDLGRFLLLAAVAVGAATGGLGFPALLVAAALIAALSSVFDVAYPSYLPWLVGRERLIEGNARLGATGSFAEIAGQPIGGGLVQLFGAPIAALIDAFSFLISAISLGLIRKLEPVPVAPGTALNVFSSLTEGMRFVSGHGLLRPLTIGAVLSNLGGGAIGALYALYGLRTLGLTPLTLGAIIGAGGLLSLLGAGLVERANRAFGFGAVLAWGWVAYAAFGFLIPLAGGPWALPLLVASQLGDVFGTVSIINQSSLRQSSVPDAWSGRVNSATLFVTRGALVLGAAFGGACAELFGLRPAMLLGAMVVFLGGVWFVQSPIRAWRELPEHI